MKKFVDRNDGKVYYSKKKSQKILIKKIKHFKNRSLLIHKRI
jgi:hypothetical protein